MKFVDKLWKLNNLLFLTILNLTQFGQIRLIIYVALLNFNKINHRLLVLTLMKLQIFGF